ncbi:MAG: FecR domain-containing protein [Nitrospinaceae bacterium]
MKTPKNKKISPMKKTGFFILFSIFSLWLFNTFLWGKEPGAITRGEFAELMTQSLPDSPILPKNLGGLSSKKLYYKMVEALNRRGFSVWKDKKPDGVLTNLEFVRVAYAFTGGAAGKSLFDQKQSLKRSGIISTTDIGLATGVEGKAVLFHQGESRGARVALASPLFMYDRVNTGINSKASFTFDDGSKITLGEDAVVKISKHIYNPDKNFRQTVIKVLVGSVRFVVTKAHGKGSLFKVVTPVVTAGVRGTEFVAMVEPSRKTTFVGLEGSFETAARLPSGERGRTAIVGRGQAQEISSRGIASEVKKASRKLMRKVRELTTTEEKVTLARGIPRDQVREIAEKVKKASHEGRDDRRETEREFEREAKEAQKEAKEEEKRVEDEAKEAAKEAEDAAKEAMKEMEDETKEAAKEAEDSAKEAAKEASQTAIKDAAKEAVKAAEDAAKDAAKEARDAAKEAAKEAETEASHSGSGHGGGG